MIKAGQLRAGKVGKNWRIRLADLPCGGSRQPADVVYLDDNASNPLHPRVTEAMIEVLDGGYGNASSTHQVGMRSRAMVEQARDQIADLVGARNQEVLFTSGATEANNLALRSLHSLTGGCLLTGAGDHPSILRAADAMVGRGAVRVGLCAGGQLDLDELDQLCAGGVGLVAVGAANSETGVLNAIRKISELVHGAGGVLFCDATQWIGRLPWSMDDLGVDAMSMSGHKMCGPQGVGALVVRRALLRKMEPMTFGGGHEQGLRPGTYNVPGIVGFGVAASLAAQPEDAARTRRLRDALEAMFAAQGATVNGAAADRLPNTSNVRFEGAPGDAVLARCPDVAASLGSACHAGALEPSPTLLAMGLDQVGANESIRFSVTRFTTRTEIDRAARSITEAVGEIRRLEAVA